MQIYRSKNKSEDFLFSAFLKLDTKHEVASFLRDLLTEQEIEEFSIRLQIAQLLLDKKLSYRKIAEKTNTSTTTVSRVSNWLNRGCGGYKKVLS
ncbi:helix-turn-helix domain-containing protein [Patescibacteria group bacterium]|nr:helix-turn-helix domain-containing protein [Patescibacteria group bacterium]